jgi:hypothetical protein
MDGTGFFSPATGPPRRFAMDRHRRHKSSIDDA